MAIKMIFSDIGNVLVRNLSHERHEDKRNDALCQILEEAKEKPVKIVFTTNNSYGITDLLPEFELQSLPDLIVDSSVTGVLKPSPDYWLKAFDLSKRLTPNINYDEILVIDDSQNNIESAKAYGFKTVLYQGNSSDIEIKNALYPSEVSDEIILSNSEEIENFINHLNH